MPSPDNQLSRLLHNLSQSKIGMRRRAKLLGRIHLLLINHPSDLALRQTTMQSIKSVISLHHDLQSESEQVNNIFRHRWNILMQIADQFNGMQTDIMMEHARAVFHVPTERLQTKEAQRFIRFISRHAAFREVLVEQHPVALLQAAMVDSDEGYSSELLKWLLRTLEPPRVPVALLAKGFAWLADDQPVPTLSGPDECPIPQGTPTLGERLNCLMCTGDSAVQETVCDALGNFSNSDVNLPMMMACGCVPAIIQAMQANPSNECLQDRACFALCDFLLDDSYRKEVLQAGCLSPIINALRIPIKGKTHLPVNASCALSNIFSPLQKGVDPGDISFELIERLPECVAVAQTTARDCRDSMWNILHFLESAAHYEPNQAVILASGFIPMLAEEIKTSEEKDKGSARADEEGEEKDVDVLDMEEQDSARSWDAEEATEEEEWEDLIRSEVNKMIYRLASETTLPALVEQVGPDTLLQVAFQLAGAEQSRFLCLLLGSNSFHCSDVQLCTKALTTICEQHISLGQISGFLQQYAQLLRDCEMLQVHQQACRVLSSQHAADDFPRCIMETGYLDVLLMTMEQFGSDSELIEHGCSILASLAETASLRPVLASSALPAIMRVVRATAVPKDAVDHCVRFLSHLAKDHDNATQLTEAGCCEAMEACGLSKESSDYTLFQHCAYETELLRELEEWRTTTPSQRLMNLRQQAVSSVSEPLDTEVEALSSELAAEGKTTFLSQLALDASLLEPSSLPSRTEPASWQVDEAIERCAETDNTHLRNCLDETQERLVSARSMLECTTLPQAELRELAQPFTDSLNSFAQLPNLSHLGAIQAQVADLSARVQTACTESSCDSGKTFDAQWAETQDALINLERALVEQFQQAKGLREANACTHLADLQRGSQLLFQQRLGQAMRSGATVDEDLARVAAHRGEFQAAMDSKRSEQEQRVARDKAAIEAADLEQRALEAQVDALWERHGELLRDKEAAIQRLCGLRKEQVSLPRLQDKMRDTIAEREQALLRTKERESIRLAAVKEMHGVIQQAFEQVLRANESREQAMEEALKHALEQLANHERFFFTKLEDRLAKREGTLRSRLVDLSKYKKRLQQALAFADDENTAKYQEKITRLTPGIEGLQSEIDDLRHRNLAQAFFETTGTALDLPERPAETHTESCGFLRGPEDETTSVASLTSTRTNISIPVRYLLEMTPERLAQLQQGLQATVNLPGDM